MYCRGFSHSVIILLLSCFIQMCLTREETLLKQKLLWQKILKVRPCFKLPKCRWRFQQSCSCKVKAETKVGLEGGSSWTTWFYSCYSRFSLQLCLQVHRGEVREVNTDWCFWKYTMLLGPMQHLYGSAGCGGGHEVCGWGRRVEVS